MLVNKHYLDEAAMAYARHKCFVFHTTMALYFTLSNGDPVNRHVIASIPSASIKLLTDVGVQPALENLINLRHLQITIAKREFHDAEDKPPGIDDFTDLDLAEIGEFRALLSLRGRIEVHAEKHRVDRVEAPQRERKRAQLLRQIEKLISEVAAKPREKEIKTARSASETPK